MRFDLQLKINNLKPKKIGSSIKNQLKIRIKKGNILVQTFPAES